MTCAAWEWFMGRHEDELLGTYDLRETHPVWKTWWFLISLAVVFIWITIFFWPK